MGHWREGWGFEGLVVGVKGFEVLEGGEGWMGWDRAEQGGWVWWWGVKELNPRPTYYHCRYRYCCLTKDADELFSNIEGLRFVFELLLKTICLLLSIKIKTRIFTE